MDNTFYYGNIEQIQSVEEYRLVEGKADGLRMMKVRNSKGLQVEICPDRCSDITRVTFKGDNLGYFSPVGNVASTYYDANGSEMVRSFTGGFLTTCGLDNVGNACYVDGVQYPLHGRISNQPAKHCFWTEDDDNFIIESTICQAGLFVENMELHRTIYVGKKDNYIKIKDTITNKSRKKTPCMILYHINIGYPLLTENAVLNIPSIDVKPRNDFAKENISKWNIIEKPNSLDDEVCYFHKFKDNGFARIFNSDIHKGIEISFDSNSLDCFTQWKMMSKYDYVLGLEPGNCFPNGRKETIQQNKIVMLDEQQGVEYQINIKIVEG